MFVFVQSTGKIIPTIDRDTVMDSDEEEWERDSWVIDPATGESVFDDRFRDGKRDRYMINPLTGCRVALRAMRHNHIYI